MNPPNVIGHHRLWVFTGIEHQLPSDPAKEASNKYLVPIKDLQLDEDINDITYIPKVQRIYFTKTGHSGTIYSQFFPNPVIYSKENDKNHLKDAKKNIQNLPVVEGSTILKLAATKRNLFCLMKDVFNNYCIIKINISSDDGLFKSLKEENVNTLAWNEEFEMGTDLEFSVIEQDDFVATVFLLSKQTKKILYGEFMPEKNRTIILNNINKIIKDLIEPISFCFITSKKRNQLCVLEYITHNLKYYEQNNNNTYKLLESFPLPPKDYNKIDYFFINTSYFTEKNKKGDQKYFIEQIILSSQSFGETKDDDSKKYYPDSKKIKCELETFNLEIGKILYPFIGQGGIDFSRYPRQSTTLNEYRLYNNTLLATIPEIAIIFNCETEGKIEMFFLLTAPVREIFFRSPPPSDIHKKNHNIKFQGPKIYEIDLS